MSKIINIKHLTGFNRVVLSDTQNITFNAQGVKNPERIGFVDLDPNRWGNLAEQQQLPAELETYVHWFD